ncbi:MAG: glycosyltransferase family 2 protein [Propionibacteriales bacterium]|nr:glycosyltransferase family 2 protein [Propionibacteriales bacterium]
MDESGVPDVSVIIPAHNAMPYVLRTLESLVGQTIDLTRLEVVVVDDGSTDGTGEELDRWADAHPGLFRVVHQAASGGPATPRNVALDLVRGRYVYFLDADDHLGPEALERLVATADETGSDIVLGKLVSTGTRGVPESMFRRNDLDADLYTSRIYWTLTALKLFRRSLLEEHRIRFPTHLPIGSDQPFTALAYLRAGRISVLSDYDFYSVVLRDDGNHVTVRGSTPKRLLIVEEMCALLAREVDDPARRAVLLARHFQVDLLTVVRRLKDSPADERAELFARTGDLVRAHLDPDVEQRLSHDARLVHHLAGRGLLTETLAAAAFEAAGPIEAMVDGGRVLARLPYLRDPAMGVPDRVYDVTDRVALRQSLASYALDDGVLDLAGTVRFTRIVTAPDDAAEIVLRRTGKKPQEYAVAATRGPDTEVDAHIDLRTVADGGPLPRGTWEVRIRLRREDFASTARFVVPPSGRGNDTAAEPPSAPWAARSRVTASGALQVVVTRQDPATPREPVSRARRLADRLRRR